ncbi:S8 family serine peptidase [Paracoccus sp. PS-1]|uniref:S8 family peptidase n=1 Tax=unclassified Paracoccus (in: a-proteobacteria) TaxID=2688777 RepID=UPI0004B27E95|nr:MULTISPECIES: S8 family serine peptidase [unclassified Paracoccus (in: a-proteobacteria)]MDQ7261897.1 S8 family serine peptidase [Paracoccus sp. PS1]
MVMASFMALRQGIPVEGVDPLTVELVYAAEQPAEAVRTRVAATLPDAELSVEPVFDAEADRYFFVDFPRIDPHGQEREIFAFARELRAAVGAAEANPVLPDSLYGSAHLGAEQESLAGLCATRPDSSRPWGWHHPLIDTIGAWQTTRGQGATVAVIDTGYSSHNELADVLDLRAERNFVEGGTDARDRFSTGPLMQPGHGTLVMSVIASRGSANAAGETQKPGGITGTAPEARIMPLRTIRSVVDFSQRQIAAAIDHAVAQGADVIAMALGGPTRVASTEAALRRAVAQGVVIVCAAGNCWPLVVFPAAYAPLGICTAVAALQPDLRPWAKTGRGPQVTFSAFGEHVWGAAKNRAGDSDAGIRASQGTTLATSISAGVAALWVARHGGRAKLQQAARQRGTTVQAMWVHCATQGMTPPPVWNGSQRLGAGVINAARALGAALPAATEAPPAPPPDAAPTLDILQMHLAGIDEGILGEVDPAMADLAPELIWLSYRAAARQRALETLAEAVAGTEAPGVPAAMPPAVAGADQPTEALARVLRDAPALRAAVGL